CVSNIVRRLGHKSFIQKIKKNKQVKWVTSWVEKRGFGLLFILLCFPFTPSALIDVVAGLSRLKMKTYMLAVLLGKAVMIFSISNIVRRLGHKSFIQKIKKNKQVKWVTSWVEKRGFGLLFILLCFPFTPSALIDVVAGLSRLKMKTYMLAVLLGKAVMIFSI